MKPLIRLLTLLAGLCALPAQAQPQGPYPPDGAYAPPGAENVSFAYADVLRTEPVFEIFRNPNPREECYDERVVTQEPVGGDPTGGTVLGAVIGGVLGNQIGGGSGRDIATVAGAAAGGYAGNKVQERMQEGNTEQVTEQRCETVYDSKEVPTGRFKVRYRQGDVEHTVKMDHDPGARLPVKDGKVVLTKSVG